MNIKMGKIERVYVPAIFAVILTVGFILNVYACLASALHALATGSADYFSSTVQGFWLLLLFAGIIIFLMIVINVFNKDYLLKPLYIATLISCVASVLGMFISDLTWMYAVLRVDTEHTFSNTLSSYFRHEWWLYALFLVLIGSLVYILKEFFANSVATERSEAQNKRIQTLLLFAPIVLSLILFPYIVNTAIFVAGTSKVFYELDSGIVFSTIYLMLVITTWIVTTSFKKRYKVPIKFFMKLSAATGVGSATAFCIPFLSIFYAKHTEILRNSLTGWQGTKLLTNDVIDNGAVFLPIFLVIIFSAIARQYFRKQQFNESKNVDETTGSFGTSSWASEEDLMKMGAYSDKGSLFGKDDKGRLLRCFTKNRTIIAAPGGGKSLGIAVPALLTEDRPVFVNDVRGELWAVTARQRAYGFGRPRKVVAIDPFRILQQADYKTGKPDDLMQIYTINPFDYISKDETQRDRDINALISSLVVREGEYNLHWDDNAEILLAGLVDFILKEARESETLENAEKTEKAEKTEPNLIDLYDCMTKDLDSINILLELMMNKGGYAKAAAAQVLKTAPEERGSIYSTTYRQVKWLVDSNMRQIFQQSNFDLRDFVKGDMDIFIVIPEDQIIFHQRVFRMLFTLVTNILSQTPPSSLPKRDILFILDELGQYGYCKDVERAIEILRARGAVIWALFQSFGQIKLYKKPDLFTNANIKQIFASDDEETMRWIQTLGGKKTVLTKTLTTHCGDSRQRMQAFGGTISKGEGENVHETGADLIHLNEIRELSRDEQFVFIRGKKAVKCKRLLYYNDAHFVGKHDPNPLARIDE